MAATKLIVFLVIGLIVGAAIGYGGSSFLQSTAPTTKTYTLGVVFPLTGTLASFGKSFVQAVNLAVGQMNQNLSSANSPIRFTTAVQDDQGTPAGALSAVQSLYQSSSAQVIIGPLTTSEVLGVRDYADTNHIVILPPASSGTAAAFPNDYIYRPGQPGDKFEGSALGQLMIQFGFSNVIYFYRGDSSGTGKYNITTAILSAAGVHYQGIEITPNQPDYSSEVASASSDVSTLVSSGVSYSKIAIMIDDYGTEAANIFTHASTDNYLNKVRWIGVEALNDNTLLSSSTTGGFMAHVNMTITTLYTPDSIQGSIFLSSFQAKYGTAPEPFSNYAYDVTWVAMLSILAAGSYNGQAVTSVIATVADHYFGASGTPTYLDPNGDQSIAYFAIDKAIPNGTSAQLTQIGLYDGSSNKVTLTGS